MSIQERELLSIFKIPPTNLVSLLLTLEDHYLKVRKVLALSSVITKSCTLGCSLPQQHPRRRRDGLHEFLARHASS